MGSLAWDPFARRVYLWTRWLYSPERNMARNVVYVFEVNAPKRAARCAGARSLLHTP